MTASFHVEHATRASRIGTAAFAAAIVLLAAAPAWGGRDDLRLLAEIYAYVALASLWNLLAGYGGLVAVGLHVFVGVGAYSLFTLSNQLHVNPWAMLPVAGAFTAGFAAISAWPMFRLTGAHFAVGTWVLAEMMRIFALNTPWLGAGAGMPLEAMSEFDR